MNLKRLISRGGILALGLGVATHSRATDVCGTIVTNQTWTAAGSPYVLTCNVAVAGAATPVLTIQAGVTVKFCQWCGLSIGNGAPGGISVQGTSSQHVTFTSNQVTPSAGYHNGIQLSTSATATSSVAYADVLYGVTMQESGVSRQIAVRFDDWPEDEGRSTRAA